MAVAALSALFFPLWAFFGDEHFQAGKLFGRAATKQREMLEIFPATRILYSRVILAVFSFFSGLLKGKGPFERRRRHRGDSSQQKEYKHSALLERTETKRSEERERGR